MSRLLPLSFTLFSAACLFSILITTGDILQAREIKGYFHRDVNCGKQN